MNPGIGKLQAYPFEKLATLLGSTGPVAGKSPINLSIGEPRHPTPGFILESLHNKLETAANYPLTRGSEELREAIAAWLCRRFSLPPSSLRAGEHILPVNGTREALFSFCQCVIDRSASSPLVVCGNPFYQIYEGAALLAGASPWYVNSLAGQDFATDYASVSADTWKRCQLLYVCSPGNPTGAVTPLETYAKLLDLAERYDFIIAADECYSEIYMDEDQAPIGLLQAANLLGHHDYRRCLVFHSLSKRSNVPGLRSGFVAGDAEIIAAYYRYRTYHGCAMAPYTQHASIAAWSDEEHVRDNRRRYREKFARVGEILEPVMNLNQPAASFYLWPQTPQADETFALGLYRQQNVTVLPGSYLSREVAGENPGEKRVRMALVASLDECMDAANRIRDYINSI